MADLISSDPIATQPLLRAPLPSRLRLVAAMIVTWSSLPYCFAYVAIVMQEFGTLPPLQTAGLVASVATVMVLSFHLGTNPLVWRRRWTLAATLVLVSIAISFGAFWPQLAEFIPRHLVLLISVPATFYVIWLSWMFFYPWKWSTRLSVLVALLACTLPYWVLLKFNGFSGDFRLHFGWRDWSRRPVAVAKPSTVATLEPNSTRGDFPQFLGPHRTGILAGVKLQRDWKQSPPKELWRRNVGAGWSSFSIYGTLAFTQEQLDSKECVTAYDLLTGSPQWVYEYSARFESSMGGLGPRATPTVHAGRVYAVGATGHLVCLDGATGVKIWAAEILQGQENIYHGVAPSPLVVESEQMVVVCPTGPAGPCLAAYELSDGQLRWRAGTDRASYCSPALLSLSGTAQLLLYNEEAVVAHDVTGKQLWRFPWSNATKTSVSQPIVVSDPQGKVFISSGYGLGSALLEVTPAEKDGDPGNVKSLWTSLGMKTKFCSAVRYGDFIYGLDEGILACISLADGTQQWKGGRYGHGQILLVGELLLVLTESGEVALVELDPKRLHELGRFPAITGKTWNNPALAGPYLLVRNSQEAACFELPTVGN